MRNGAMPVGASGRVRGGAETVAEIAGDRSFAVGAARDAGSPLALFEPGVRTAHDVRPAELALPGRLAALPVVAAHPPHHRLDALCRLAVPGVVMPIARFGGNGGDWIACRTPVGPSVAAVPVAGNEATLLATVLRPVARTLVTLGDHKLTHRAIRPENVFMARDGAIQLGPFWLGPPAIGQDSVFEAPAVASCLPEARGPGVPADDVYALGVLLLSLLIGARPLDGLAGPAVIRRKLERGSLATLLDGRSLPSHWLDLLGAMLADEPTQRPSPERLAGGGLVVGPKITLRRDVNAAVPLVLEEHAVWTTPQLANLIGDAPDRVRQALRLGLVDHWLRRSLNEVVLAERIEAVVRPGGAPPPLDGEDGVRSDIALLRIARLLDPQAPLVWRGLRLEPSGLGSVLASLDTVPAATRAALIDLLGSDALRAYADTIDDLPARESLTMLAKRLRQVVNNKLLLRHAMYELNPSLGCRSAMLGGEAACTLGALLVSLETEAARNSSSVMAGRPDARSAATLAPQGAAAPFRLDTDLLAFIATRRRPSRVPTASRSALDDLRQLAALAHEAQIETLPALARHCAREALAELAAWPGQTARASRRQLIEEVAASGRLDELLATLVDDEPRRAAEAASAAARQRLDLLTRRRDALLADEMGRRALAERFGRDGLAVIGAGATALALLAELVL